MVQNTKILLARALTALAVVAALWSVLHVLVAGSGWVIPAWWGGYVVGACGLLAVAAAVLSYRVPRQRAALATNSIVIVAHVAFWVWLLSAAFAV